MINEKKLSGLVVWYNPEKNDIANIDSYVAHIDKLYIIDNSNQNNQHLLSYRPFSGNIEYIPNGKNLGIATALNIGCQRAIEDGYEWILTMDQDSSFLPSHFELFITQINQLSANQKTDDIAIYAPSRERDKKGNKFVTKVITSGNILSLADYSEVQGFDDQLFIDEVDHDMCFRLLKNNKKIYKFLEPKLKHLVGNSKTHHFFFSKRTVMHHSAFRKYYIFRNRLIMMKRFPQYTRKLARDNRRLIINTILFEDDKIAKLKAIYRGFKDYKQFI